MIRLDLRTLVINADTIQETHQRGENIWKKAETEPNMVFMAPEQLISDGFNGLLKDDSAFLCRVCLLAVDEAHILNTWGAAFRKVYHQIGWIRARLHDVVFLALTATMRDGKPIENVCEFLGLHQGRFHLIRRSNARPEVQILFREMKSGFGGQTFPELDWILQERCKTLIFCRTINLGFRVYTYLYYQSVDDSGIGNRIRLYNALNWPTYNEKTRELMDNDAVCQIVIGTDTLSVGVDIGSVQDVIVLDEPEDIDDLFQKFGRPGRDRNRVKDPWGILYTGQKTLEIAQKVVDAAGSQGSSKKVVLQKETHTMDLSMAHMHLASCKYGKQNGQYGNMPNGILCTDSCQSCQKDPPPSPVFPCYCSGCKPEDIFRADVPMGPTRTSSITLDIPKSRCLTKVMRAHGTKQLEKF